MSAQLEKAYFATGCFWGAERRFWSMPGVERTSVGYMGGTKAEPTYQEVCTGRTGHAEMVEVEYNPTVVSYHRLLAEFWSMHDPTSLNRQGGDIGTQYRSAIFYHSEEQKFQAEASKFEKEENFKVPIVTSIESIGPFYPAEDYHQKYLQLQKNKTKFC
jgi:peptide-methionine (S)-S-oxide reductase